MRKLFHATIKPLDCDNVWGGVLVENHASAKAFNRNGRRLVAMAMIVRFKLTALHCRDNYAACNST